MIPIGRLDGTTGILFADGHTDTDQPANLDDMRMWWDAARGPEDLWRAD